MFCKKTKKDSHEKDDNHDKNCTIKCTNCCRELKYERYLKCSQCSEKFLCLDCYSVVPCYDPPNELGEVRCHDFIIIDPNPKPIFRSDWNSNEELLLLNGIRLLGVGNWNSISNFMKTKTSQQIEAHYFQTYIYSPSSPFPEQTVLKPAVVDPLPNFNTRPMESCPSVGHEKNLKEKNKKEKTTFGELSGWMPYRHEFETEFNNEAEDLVANIEFKNETEKSFADKIRNLSVYNTQLIERQFRNRVVEDYRVDIIERKDVTNESEGIFESRVLGGVTREQKDIDRDLLMPLTPYRDKKEIIEIADNFHKLYDYCNRIEKLCRYSINGVRSLHEGRLFDELYKCETVENWNKCIENFQKNHKTDCSPGLTLLNQKEAELCERNNIHPQFYFAFKDLLLREYQSRGHLTKEEAIELSLPDKNHILAIYNLFTSLGWI